MFAMQMSGQDSEQEDILAMVRRVEASADAAVRMVLGAYETQIRELAKAAIGELAFGRDCAADIVQDGSDRDNLGEGYWEVVLTECSAKHICRFAREARYWAACHAEVTRRLAAGEPAVIWERGPQSLQGRREAIQQERFASEESQ